MSWPIPGDPSHVRALLAALDAARYEFITITPASHARAAARWRGPGAGLRDLFGWSRAVEPGSIAADIMAAARAARVIIAHDGGVASTMRVSRLAGRLFAHSAWPTDDADSVFLVPDSYRFATFIARTCPNGDWACASSTSARAQAWARWSRRIGSPVRR